MLVFEGGRGMMVPDETAVPYLVDVASSVLVVRDVKVGGYVVVRGPHEDMDEVTELVGVTPSPPLVSCGPVGRPLPLYPVPLKLVPVGCVPLPL